MPAYAPLPGLPPEPELGPPPLSADEARRFEALRGWRRRVAAARGYPPYIVAWNRVLDAVARWNPATLEELATVPGIGPAKLATYGPGLLAALHAPVGEVAADDLLVRLVAVLAAADLVLERGPSNEGLRVRLPGGGPAIALVPEPTPSGASEPLASRAPEPVAEG